MRIPGHITKEMAKEIGMTHHASYYGIPIWYAEDAPYGAKIEAKWYPMFFLFIVGIGIESIMRSTLYPGDDPAIQIVVGKEI